MQIKLDPISKLWCREDGAVLLPPRRNIHRFTYTWTFGSKQSDGYRSVQYKGKHYLVHRIVCRAFDGLPPRDKPFVDHIDRCKTNNKPSNLHWVSNKENCDNKDRVDKSIERYGVRACEDRQTYMKTYYAMHHEEFKARNKAYRERRKVAGFLVNS